MCDFIVLLEGKSLYNRLNFVTMSTLPLNYETMYGHPKLLQTGYLTPSSGCGIWATRLTCGQVVILTVTDNVSSSP